MRVLRVGLLLICLCGRSSAAPTLSYTVTDLGVLDDTGIHVLPPAPFQPDSFDAAGNYIVNDPGNGSARGQVVGAGGVRITIDPLPGDLQSHAIAMAANGFVAAWSIDPTGFSRPVFWDGTSHAIPLLPGATRMITADVNSLGQVVGWGNRTIGDLEWVYQDGITYDLNTILVDATGWVIHVVHAIDEDGRITGFASYGGADHRYLLTPTAGSQIVEDQVTLEPEPPTGTVASITLLVVSAGKIWRMRRDRPPWFTWFDRILG